MPFNRSLESSRTLPELPEVETIRLGLARHISGKTITKVDVLHPRPVRSHPKGAAGFAKDVENQKFLTPRRRGKYLWLPFETGDAIIAHLGMSGQFRINCPSDSLVKNTRVIFWLDDSTQLRFVDQRMFGGLSISVQAGELPNEISHIGLDPFDPEFDQKNFAKFIRSKNTSVKRALLNQSWISGIGNIYADETLWTAKVHYASPVASLSISEWEQLISAAKQVMGAALAAGGTSFDPLYVNVDGESGYFARELKVYGRAGKECFRCHNTIVREPFMNRSAFLCRRCQRKRTAIR